MIKLAGFPAASTSGEDTATQENAVDRIHAMDFCP